MQRKQRVTGMRYEWAERRWQRHYVSPQVVGKHLEELRARTGGELTPQCVVDDARPPDAPTHPLFEWNDAVAAEGFRQQQARQVMNSLRLVMETEGGETREIMAYGHIVHPERGHRYVNIVQAVSTPDYRRQLLEEALRYMEGFRRRYEHLEEMEPILKAIGRVRSRVSEPSEARDRGAA